MAALTLLQMAQRAKSESGRSGVGPAAVSGAVGDDLRIINAVRDAWRELQLEPYNWAWMRKEAVVPLSSGAALQPAETLGITDLERWVPQGDDYAPTVSRAAEPTVEWPARFVEFEAFRHLFLVGDHAAGPPQFWAINPAGELLVGPKPEAAGYQVRIAYFAEPTELVADGDAPNMPDRFHTLLVWRALMQVAGSDAAPEHYSRARDSESVMHNALLASQAARIAINARPLA